MILNSEEKVRELHNLLNSFEKCFPVIRKKIEKYKIDNLKDKCFLAWHAGQVFFNKNLNISKDIFMDYFFKKIFETFKLKNIEEKSALFTFFSLGAVVSLNDFEQVKIILNDYYKIIANGIVLIQTVKFDVVENGIKKWRFETVKKFSKFNENDNEDNVNAIREFNKIINTTFNKKDEIKILN